MTEEKTKGLQAVRFEQKNDILYRLFTHPYVNQGQPLRQIVVPKELRKQLIEVGHNSIVGGHLGVKKTADKILSNFYWPGIHIDVRHFCWSCDVCQRTIPKGRVTKVPLSKMPLIDEPFKRVAIDLVGPIYPPSDEGHRYILTLVDYATRYPEAVALKGISTEEVAEALVNIYCRVGIPEEVLSDMGTQFVSDCMKEVSRLLSIHQLTTTPYHPMCNGLVEKFNGTLKTMLKRMCSEQPRMWHRYINPLLFAYREVPQSSTGFSPFELLYARNVRGPMKILRELWTKETPETEVKNSYQYVFDLREKLEETLQLAQSELEKAQGKYKHHYDKKARKRKLKVDDFVLILRPTDLNKLLMQWKGPYKVKGIQGDNNYQVDVKGKIKTYHANLLKQYITRDDNVEVPQDNTEGTVLAQVAIAVIEPGNEEINCSVDDENLLELGVYQPKDHYMMLYWVKASLRFRRDS